MRRQNSIRPRRFAPWAPESCLLHLFCSSLGPVDTATVGVVTAAANTFQSSSQSAIMVRLWVLLVPSLLLAGCLVPEPGVVAPAEDEDARELAWSEYTKRHGDRDDHELRAIVAYEALDLDGRDGERRTFPNGVFLSPVNGGRLDGDARSWVYIYKDPGGGDSGYVYLLDGQWVGSGWMSGTYSRAFEHFDAGQAPGEARVSATEAAATARATGVFDDILADPAWDVSTSLQQRTGAATPIWLFEAFARDASGLRAVAVDATTGALVETATESVIIADTASWSVLAPSAEPRAVLEVPALGFDWLVIDAARGSTAWTIYDPTGDAWNGPPAMRDPMPGEWQVVYEGAMPLMAPEEIRFCLLERSPFDDDPSVSCA